MFALLALYLLSAMCIAQAVMTLLLNKGEICPGQRGRLHKTLPWLVFAWLGVIPVFPIALLPLIALAVFSFYARTDKTRDKGPMTWLWLSNASAFVVLTYSFTLQTVPMALLTLFGGAILGSIMIHCLMIQARSRLQAFHQILPLSGIVLAIAAIFALLWELTLNGFTTASSLMGVIVILVSLVIGLLMWSSHILLRKTFHKNTILCALCLIVTSLSCQSWLLSS